MAVEERVEQCGGPASTAPAASPDTSPLPRPDPGPAAPPQSADISCRGSPHVPGDRRLRHALLQVVSQKHPLLSPDHRASTAEWRRQCRARSGQPHESSDLPPRTSPEYPTRDVRLSTATTVELRMAANMCPDESTSPRAGERVLRRFDVALAAVPFLGEGSEPDRCRATKPAISCVSNRQRTVLAIRGKPS